MVNVDTLVSGVKRGIVVLGKNKKPLARIQNKEKKWFVDKLTATTDNPLSTVIEISGQLQINSLQLAFNNVINDHEILRTVFNKDDASCGITGNDYLNIHVLDFSRASFLEIKHFIFRVINKSFELPNVSAIRTVLVKAGNDFHYLCVALHPKVTDKWSMDLFCDQMIRKYESIECRESSELPKTDLQYSEYLSNQKHRRKLNAKSQQAAYWEDQLLGCNPAYLDKDFRNLGDNEKKYAVVNHPFSDIVSESLRNEIANLRIDTNIYALACFKILLSKCTGQHELIVGIPFDNREEEGLEKLFGPIENTLPIRSNIDPAKTFKEYLLELKKVYEEAVLNQDIASEKVLTLDNDHQNLIQTKFVYQDLSEKNSIKFSGLRFDWSVSPIENCPYEMTFTLVQEAEGLSMYVVYRADLYAEATIAKIIRQFDHLFSVLTIESARPLSTISLIQIPESEAFDSSILSSFRKDEGLVTATDCMKVGV